MDTIHDVATFQDLLTNLVNEKLISLEGALKMSLRAHRFGIVDCLKNLQSNSLQFDLAGSNEVVVIARFSDHFWMD